MMVDDTQKLMEEEARALIQARMSQDKPGLKADIRAIWEAMEEKYFGSVYTTLEDDLGSMPLEGVTTYAVGPDFDLLNADGLNLIRPGMFVIGGNFSSGKSSFCSSLGVDILRKNAGAGLLLYSLDDAKMLAGRRVLSQLTGTDLITGTMSKDTIREKCGNILSRIVIREFLDLDKIEHEANLVQKKTKSEFLVIGIDYVQLVTVKRSTDPRVMANIVTKELKEIVKALPGCLMMLLSQMARGEAYMGGARYRESSEIENQGDCAIDIDPVLNEDDGKWNFESPDRRIKVMKNKIGPRGKEFLAKMDRAYNFVIEPKPKKEGKKAGGKSASYDDGKNKKTKSREEDIT